MPLRIQCPRCQAQYDLPDAAAGTQVRCGQPHCRQTLSVDASRVAFQPVPTAIEVPPLPPAPPTPERSSSGPSKLLIGGGVAIGLLVLIGVGSFVLTMTGAFEKAPALAKVEPSTPAEQSIRSASDQPARSPSVDTSEPPGSRFGDVAVETPSFASGSTPAKPVPDPQPAATPETTNPQNERDRKQFNFLARISSVGSYVADDTPVRTELFAPKSRQQKAEENSLADDLKRLAEVFSTGRKAEFRKLAENYYTWLPEIFSEARFAGTPDQIQSQMRRVARDRQYAQTQFQSARRDAITGSLYEHAEKLCSATEREPLPLTPAFNANPQYLDATYTGTETLTDCVILFTVTDIAGGTCTDGKYYPTLTANDRLTIYGGKRFSSRSYGAIRLQMVSRHHLFESDQVSFPERWAGIVRKHVVATEYEVKSRRYEEAISRIEKFLPFLKTVDITETDRSAFREEFAAMQLRCEQMLAKKKELQRKVDKLFASIDANTDTRRLTYSGSAAYKSKTARLGMWLSYRTGTNNQVAMRIFPFGKSDEGKVLFGRCVLEPEQDRVVFEVQATTATGIRPRLGLSAVYNLFLRTDRREYTFVLTDDGFTGSCEQGARFEFDRVD